MKILQTADYDDMSRKAANIISAQVILNSHSVLGLATGSTPIGVYRQLAAWYRKGDLDFSQVHTFNLDEYCGLSADHPQSYHRFMQENFFSAVNVPAENVNIPDGTAADIEAECRDYDRRIQSIGGIDLQLLGLGNTGHIGFNEPNERFDKTTHRVALKPETIRANSRFFGSEDLVPRYAITMGIKNIMQARKIILVVSGAAKADILEQALFGPVTPRVPASILQFHPDVTVVADNAALRRILEKGLLEARLG